MKSGLNTLRWYTKVSKKVSNVTVTCQCTYCWGSKVWATPIGPCYELANSSMKALCLRPYAAKTGSSTYMHIKINPNGGSLIERKLEFIIIIIINFLSDKDKATLPKRCGGWLGPKGTTKTHLWVKNNPVHSCVVGKWSDEQAGCHRWDAAAQTSKQQSLRKATHTHTRARAALFFILFFGKN